MILGGIIDHMSSNISFCLINICILSTFYKTCVRLRREESFSPLQDLMLEGRIWVGLLLKRRTECPTVEPAWQGGGAVPVSKGQGGCSPQLLKEIVLNTW